MLPLTNRRILITRAPQQASALAGLLAEHGATPILIPTIELAPPSSWESLDDALASLGTYDWLLFTSANAVQALAARGQTLNRALGSHRIAAIGPATASAVAHAFGYRPNIVPASAVAEGLADALLPHASGARMLLVRAAVARDTLPNTLSAAGAQVTLAEAYRTVVPADSAAALRDLFAAAPPDAVTFTSASTAHNFVALLEAAGVNLPRGVVLASIGPITSAAMRELGLEPTVEAAQATIASLVQSLYPALLPL
jgi:uroporphyrinogen-III synthase